MTYPKTEFLNRSNAMRFLSFLICISVFANIAVGQTRSTSRSTKVEAAAAAPEALVAPVVFDGQNIKCADLNDSTDIRFAHIVTDYELKLNFGDPNGTFPFTTGGGRIVVGPQDATKSVTIASGSATVSSWSSQIPITAINVKVGNTSYVYPYNPAASADTNLATGDHRGISHITLCFGEPGGGTTAGDGAIGGRVLNTYGVGISNARLTLVDAASGETVTALTNAFGFYMIDNIAVGEFYTLSVSHKRYRFADPMKAISMNDSLVGVDFVANP